MTSERAGLPVWATFDAFDVDLSRVTEDASSPDTGTPRVYCTEDRTPECNLDLLVTVVTDALS